MTDSKTLAYINLYGVLGSLSALCACVPEAKKILGNAGCSIGFTVKDGPAATLTFVGGSCIIREGADDCTVKIPFSSPEKFNGMVDGTVTPIPTKGFTKLPFLLGKFKKLTDLLESYLRPAPEKLADEAFLRQSTIVMFRVIVAAIAQIGNHDRIGQFSASNMPDGAIKFEIPGAAKAAILIKNGTLTYSDKIPKDVTSVMTFADIRTARDLFDGKINAVAAVGNGGVKMAGMIPQLDNANRILSRVEMYLR
ncbi:MAG: hypothetical protein IJX93_08350 [Clostridia bacterium]|nr:hypothetical protein [Clostridia bacterium]MBQ8333768.1 hypothetical protein [Clostridia bacterium]MBQ8370225.1 hypothetical protein [Clostridia bacterium]MBQ8513748.1 hypothetical protein [Clostridia bacterium]